jgi:hypothetical protein
VKIEVARSRSCPCRMVLTEGGRLAVVRCRVHAEALGNGGRVLSPDGEWVKA